MLQIKQICKQYRTGGLTQQALDHVDLSFRDSEFVAILGPSGSGKTTLLNIIGGLDRYDSGDLVINGVSTKRYTNRDWDTYRNHTVGFIFQSYNLIPHQSILSNVELTLTVSGVSRAERRKRAVAALEQVGLGKHLHKRPNQLSGGQMQRVAIARALVNDPDVLLADEPTGALDSETSVQVMELLKEVARDRLVVMVTHNPELAQAYATRIVRLSDGVIRSDTDPFTPPPGEKEPEHKKWARHSSMSLLTALSLSFQNLRSKKARTLLTAFAGSIGIIGIALILSLSTGVNQYIESVEEDTLSEYPLQIQSSSLDLASMAAGMMGSDGEEEEEYEVNVSEMLTQMFSKIGSNDLASLKEYLETGGSGIETYLQSISYSYSVTPQIYLWKDGDYRQVNPDQSFAALGIGSGSSGNSMMSAMMSTDTFHEMPEDPALYENQYEVKAGRWPEAYNECVLVLTSGGNVSDLMLYALGLRDGEELDHMVEQFAAEENVDVPQGITGFSYDDVIGITYRLVNASDYYSYDEEFGVWTDHSDDEAFLRELVPQGEELTIVGVVQPADGVTASMLTAGINYPASLTRHVMDQAAGSEIVKQQLAEPTVNVFTGTPFGQQEENSLALENLFTVDEDALADAFSIDTGALESSFSSLFDPAQFTLSDSALEGFDLSSLDLSSLDLSDIDMGDLDLSALAGQIDWNVTSDQLSALTADLMAGYNAYLTSSGSAGAGELQDSFREYLQSPEAAAVLAETLGQILEEQDLTVPASLLQTLLESLLRDYVTWQETLLEEEPWNYPGTIDAYLQTDRAQIFLTAAASQLLQLQGGLNLSDEQLQQAAAALLAGYETYAQANGAPSLSEAGASFQEYLQTEDAQSIIASHVETWAAGQESSLQEQLQEQFRESMEETMRQAAQEVLRQLAPQVMEQVSAAMGQAMASQLETAPEQLAGTLQDAFHVDAGALQDAIHVNMTEEELSALLRSSMASRTSTLDGNLQSLGYADPDEPSAISLYPLNFEAKEHVLEILDSYNAQMEANGEPEKIITYTDLVGTLMSSVTDIINIISYVLMAFVAISLIVSSIMIGVITYISVLERKKEIGILRAIGASKSNISQVFNAETFIIGLCAGLLGIGVTLLVLIPGNQIIHNLAGTNEINAVLPAGAALILVAISVVLTLLGGLIPSRKAAKQDPVTALRTE